MGLSPAQRRLNRVFDSIENEYASELRSEKRIQNELAYNNSLLKRKVDNLNNLFMVYVYV